MRILVTTTLPPNLYHAKLLPLLRAEPSVDMVVVTDRPGPVYDRVRWRWPTGGWRWLGRLGGRLALLVLEVLHPRVKLVMAYNLVPHGLFAVLVARLRRVPVFVHLISGPGEIRFAHDPEITDNRLISRSRHPRAWERLARWIARSADRIFVPGRATRRFLLDEGFDPHRVFVLHSAVDPDRFFFIDRPRDIDVLVCAQLCPRKRPLFTLRVLAAVRRRRPNSRFCWLGDGIMRQEFGLAVEDLGLSDCLDRRWTDDVASFYRRARVFLLCSVNEGLSLACMESIACGVVPVTTSCGDMAEIVRSGETGELLSTDATEDDFVERIVSLLENERGRQRYVNAGRALVAREHGFSRAEALWAEQMQWITDSADNPR